MKLLFLVFINLSMPLFANSLLFQSEGALYLYNIKSNSIKTLLRLSSINGVFDENCDNYQLSSICHRDDSIIITLYQKHLENINIVFYDREYELKSEQLIFLRSRKLIPNENNVYGVNVITSEGYFYHESINDFPLSKYGYAPPANVKIKSDGLGNIMIYEGANNEYILQKSVIDKIQRGFYSPDISKENEWLICHCEYYKYNRKNQVSSAELIELNLNNRSIRYLGIYGREPKYSPDLEYILYKSKNGKYIVINRISLEPVCEIEAINIFWV